MRDNHRYKHMWKNEDDLKLQEAANEAASIEDEIPDSRLTMTTRIKQLLSSKSDRRSPMHD